MEGEIYLKFPTVLDLITGEEYDSRDCLILLKAMYRLVQAAHQFYKKLNCVTVTKMGFVKCEADGYLLIRVNDIGTAIICIYVDDMLVVGDNEAVEAFKLEIKHFFNTTKEGPMEEYVGYKVVRKSNNKIHMFQPNTMHKL